MKCPVNRDQAKPCPMMNPWQNHDRCVCCLDDWSAYAAKIEFDAGATRREAEKFATEWLREQLERAESPQMEIKL